MIKLLTIFLLLNTNLMANELKEEVVFKDMISFVENTIDVVQTVLYHRKKKLARFITKTAVKYNLDPRLMVAIINTESKFDRNAYNPSGDYSLVQINYRIWKKEFKKRKLRPLDKKKLVYNEDYAIDRMGEILSILKREYSRKEKLWYLRYHSATDKYQKRYLRHLKKEIAKIIKVKHNNLF